MIWVVLSAWNEAKVIGPLLQAIAEVARRDPEPWRVVVVDDGSRDDTHAVAEHAARAAGYAMAPAEGTDLVGGTPSLTVLRHRENRGLGAGLRTGFEHVVARADDSDVIVTLDADLTHPPAQIPELVARVRSGYDLAIASRYRAGAEVKGVPGSRRVLSDGGRFVFQLLFPTPGVRDYTCCFRAYAVPILRRAQLAYGGALSPARGFEAVMDILLALRPLGVRATEIPLQLDYSGRIGASKMKVMSNIRRTLALLGRRWVQGFGERSPSAVRRRIAEAERAQAATARPDGKRRVKIGILVGTRPEIVKMAPIVRACSDSAVPIVLVHTGQHYSFEMDAVFFQELGLPAADVNLEVGSGTAAYQVGSMLMGLGPVLEQHRPDVLLVEGDTHSVLAGALAARHLDIAVGHVEAGLRSYDPGMPEELNRVLADHASTFLFAPTAHARDILLGEGLPADAVFVTGNTVVDELMRQRERALATGAPARHGVEPGRYAVATVHRRENVDRESRLRGIFEGLEGAARALDAPVLAALHPRTSAALERLGLASSAVRRLPPLGYLEFMGLQAQAALVLTDSGGLQEEACALGVPCVTLRDNTERPESVACGANVLAGADPRAIVDAATRMAARPRNWDNPFGDGRAGERIVEILRERLGARR